MDPVAMAFVSYEVKQRTKDRSVTKPHDECRLVYVRTVGPCRHYSGSVAGVATNEG